MTEPSPLSDADFAAIEARLREFRETRAAVRNQETSRRYLRAYHDFILCAEDDINRLLAELRRERSEGAR